MNDCIFCKIARKEINADIIKEDADWICFKDVNPKAPVHLLIIPKKHYENLHMVEDEQVFGKLMMGVKNVVKELGLESKGYRVVINTGNEGGQTVAHLHFHILAKRPMGWPPG
jgi:histidine triad (HIT) family protein